MNNNFENTGTDVEAEIISAEKGTNNNNMENPEIDNDRLESERNLAEKVINVLKLQISKNESFIADPSAGIDEVELAKTELETLNAELAEAETGLAGLDNQYNEALMKRLEEIQATFQINEPELEQAA